MRREPDHFEDQPLMLLYIARKLKESLAMEKLLNEADVDYLIEVDTYVGGIIFRSERAGAFFSVAEGDWERAAQVVREKGYKPQVEEG
ncbi:MAG: hypothetical protein JJE04_15265 [Acidobacteriia bacterium]|nr:hypothetical protein [Terriglobia bacterium]